jgi:hypothetical protein
MERCELRRLRLLPINQVASIKLKAIGLAENDEVQPVFQLMELGLANGVPLAQQRTARELLRLRFELDQASALDYLLAGIPGGLPGLHRNLLHSSPHAAAELLLDILDMRLRADPCTPCPEEPEGPEGA